MIVFSAVGVCPAVFVFSGGDLMRHKDDAGLDAANKRSIAAHTTE